MSDMRTSSTSTEQDTTSPVETVETVPSSPEITVIPDPQPAPSGHGPAAQIFSEAAIYRPITIATSLAAVLFMFYGVFAAGTLVTTDGSPNQAEQVSQVAGAIAASPAADASPTECSLVEVETYLDFDGNGVRNGDEGPVGGIPITVRSPEGMEFLSETDPDGRLAFQLSTPSRLTLEADSMQAVGMWPAPRLGTLGASEIVLSGPTCSTSLGYLWVPPGAQTPRVGWAPGSVDVSGTPAQAASALVGRKAGVQAYGRLWYDVDGDRLFSMADDPAAGVEIILFDELGNEITRLTSNELGAYSFAGMSPRTVYEVRIDAPVARARALGWVAETPTNSAFIRTGAIGLPVWGVDFILDDASDPAETDATVGVDRAS